MIYHYCNLDALIAIMKNKVIWASNYRYLNDAKEINIAVEKIDDNIDLIKKGIESFNGYQSVIRCLKSSMVSYDYYITSFSQEPDVLSQWRAYAQNGRGASIGFDEKVLIKLDLKIHEAIYGDTLIDSVIELGKGYLTKRKESASIKIDQLESEFAELIGSFKGEAFKEEREKRLIIMHKKGTKTDNIHFRKSGNFVVPFLEVSFDSLSNEIIREIWIGPSQKDEDTKRSVQFLLNYLGYSQILLKTSLASFRD